MRTAYNVKSLFVNVALMCLASVGCGGKKVTDYLAQVAGTTDGNNFMIAGRGTNGERPADPYVSPFPGPAFTPSETQPSLVGRCSSMLVESTLGQSRSSTYRARTGGFKLRA